MPSARRIHRESWPRFWTGISGAQRVLGTAMGDTSPNRYSASQYRNPTFYCNLERFGVLGLVLIVRSSPELAVSSYLDQPRYPKTGNRTTFLGPDPFVKVHGLLQLTRNCNTRCGCYINLRPMTWDPKQAGGQLRQ